MRYIRSIFFCGLILANLYSCNSEKPEDKSTRPNTDTVKVFTAKSEVVEKTITLPGELLPNERAELKAKIQGYVKKIRVDIGSIVKKGTVLILIDAPEINSRKNEMN